MKKKAIVIGAGFAGLSAASYLAKNGLDVIVLEKSIMTGGRARLFVSDGFSFDTGPSWYWMPDVFERYFADFGKNVHDLYQLVRLDPSYRIYWPEGFNDLSANYSLLKSVFESIEKGAGASLDKFLAEAKYKYTVGINKLIQKPALSLTEFVDIDLAKGMLRLDVFTNMRRHLQKYFKHPKLRQMLEFPVLFLGAMPQHIPALYSLMNYADIQLGTWYPQGGMYKVVEAMYATAVELGVQFCFNTNVEKIEVEAAQAKKVVANSGKDIFEADVVVSNADYHFTEQVLLEQKYRSYPESYWQKRTMAPSCLLYFVGLNKKLENVVHHSLFFDVDFDRHGEEIYADKVWPQDPLFYVSITSVTDSTVAPDGCENLVFLVPVAAGLSGDSDTLRKTYFEKILNRFEEKIGQEVKHSIVCYHSYSVSNFEADFNAFKGNAYGLANTLMQTAVFKPKMRSKKVKNLFFTGQLTVPGPGVPPSLISGEVVAKEVAKLLA